MKPVKRSKLRIWAGSYYYTLKRYLEWYVGNDTFAVKQTEQRLPYTVFAHRTPLLRKLKDVDMWLQYNKIRNLKIAVNRLDGLLLRPGETFSYWKRLGKPTRQKGYVEGMVLHYGRYRKGIGGGLCQLSNLIYWLTLHTPLTVTERHRHSYDVFPDSSRTQPFGTGATCAYNYLDLRIYNGTNQAFQLKVRLTDHHLAGEWLSEEEIVTSYKVYEKLHKITFEPPHYYIRHNLIHRYVLNKRGDLLKDEYVTENHALMMYEPLLETGTTFANGSKPL